MREDRDLRTYTRRGALGLMGAGGVFAATETFGFTELTADRGVGINVDGDDSGAIGVLGDDTALSDVSNVDDDLSISISNNSDTTISSSDLSVTASVTESVTSSGGGNITIKIDPGNKFDKNSVDVGPDSSDETFTLSDSLDTGSASLDLSTATTTDSGNSLTFKFTFDASFDETQVKFSRSGIKIESTSDV